MRSEEIRRILSSYERTVKRMEELFDCLEHFGLEINQETLADSGLYNEGKSENTGNARFDDWRYLDKEKSECESLLLSQEDYLSGPQERKRDRLRKEYRKLERRITKRVSIR